MKTTRAARQYTDEHACGGIDTYQPLRSGRRHQDPSAVNPPVARQRRRSTISFLINSTPHWALVLLLQNVDWRTKYQACEGFEALATCGET